MVAINQLSGTGTLPSFEGRDKLACDAFLSMIARINAGISASGVKNIQARSAVANVLNSLAKYVKQGYYIMPGETLKALEEIAQKFAITTAGETEDFLQYLAALNDSLQKAIDESFAKTQTLEESTRQLHEQLEEQKSLTIKISQETDLQVATANKRVAELEQAAAQKEAERRATIIAHNQYVTEQLAIVDKQIAETELQITNAQAILDSLTEVRTGLPSSTLWPPDYPGCVPAFGDCCGCAPLENMLKDMVASASEYYVGTVNGVTYAYPKTLKYKNWEPYTEGHMINEKSKAFQLYISPFVTQQEKYAKHRWELMSSYWSDDYQP